MSDSDEFSLILYLFLGNIGGISKIHQHAPYFPTAALQLECPSHSFFFLGVINVNCNDVFVIFTLSQHLLAAI
jgi:hypothetical protein